MMAISGKSRGWRLILAFVCALPGSTLGGEVEGQLSGSVADQPVAVEPAPPSDGDDSGVRSRAPSSGSVQDPALRPFQKIPVPLLKAPIPPDMRVQVGPAPSNVTLTPVTPTSIRIQWSPSPGAVRYLISRNGAPDIPIEANAGFFDPQNNRFGYIDAGRHPAMLHTYSVIAQFPEPTLPGRSISVQMLTPPVLPPDNFRATMSGPSAVTLNWINRSEAIKYRIVRNGGSLPPAVFDVTGISYVDQNLPSGEYRYSISTIVRLATGEERDSEYSKPTIIKARPFNIVAVGDSVMWGQGLRPENKFAVKVKEWVKGVLGKPVNLYLDGIAHSGAVTFPAPGEDPHDQSNFPGEIPASYPSIKKQIAELVQKKVEPKDVDLVLVDGCINNVDVINILRPALADEGFRAEIRSYCSAGMQNVLTLVAEKFPNAKIIVNGYFPIISRESNLSSVVALWVGVGVITAGLIPPDPIFGGAIIAAFRETAAARSDMFFQESTNNLQSVVAVMNSLPPPLGGNRFRFAALPANAQTAYAASDTWLWLIPVRGIVQDEVFDARSAECNMYQSGNLKCYAAAMGHPNVRGAQAYTNAITSVAAPFVSEWRNIHVLSGQAQNDPLTIRVQSGMIEPGGGTFVATAYDGPTGPSLQGTVQLNGVPAGELGSQIRYVYRENNPTDLLVSVSVPNRPPRFFTIPIRKQSVAANVTNNADPRTVVVAASDSVTGQLLNGTVFVHTPSSQVSGQTGQPLTYPSCGSIPQDNQFIASGLVSGSGPVPCTGFVKVPGYPDASFEDLPGGIKVFSIQNPSRLKLQRAP